MHEKDHFLPERDIIIEVGDARGLNIAFNNNNIYIYI